MWLILPQAKIHLFIQLNVWIKSEVTRQDIFCASEGRSIWDFERVSSWSDDTSVGYVMDNSSGYWVFTNPSTSVLFWEQLIISFQEKRCLAPLTNSAALLVFPCTRLSIGEIALPGGTVGDVLKVCRGFLTMCYWKSDSKWKKEALRLYIFCRKVNVVLHMRVTRILSFTNLYWRLGYWWNELVPISAASSNSGHVIMTNQSWHFHVTFDKSFQINDFQQPWVSSVMAAMDLEATLHWVSIGLYLNSMKTLLFYFCCSLYSIWWEGNQTNAV